MTLLLKKILQCWVLEFMTAFQSLHLETGADKQHQENLKASLQGFECQNLVFVIGSYKYITS